MEVFGMLEGILLSWVFKIRLNAPSTMLVPIASTLTRSRDDDDSDLVCSGQTRKVKGSSSWIWREIFFSKCCRFFCQIFHSTMVWLNQTPFKSIKPLMIKVLNISNVAVSILCFKTLYSYLKEENRWSWIGRLMRFLLFVSNLAGRKFMKVWQYRSWKQ